MIFSKRGVTSLLLYLIFAIWLIFQLAGCVQHTLTVSNGKGDQDNGPDIDSSRDSSRESQQNTDSISELSSRISGIDKSNQDIKRTLHKTSETVQQQQHRDEAKDRLDPDLPRNTRRMLYEGVD